MSAMLSIARSWPETQQRRIGSVDQADQFVLRSLNSLSSPPPSFSKSTRKDPGTFDVESLSTALEDLLSVSLLGYWTCQSRELMRTQGLRNM